MGAGGRHRRRGDSRLERAGAIGLRPGAGCGAPKVGCRQAGAVRRHVGPSVGAGPWICRARCGPRICGPCRRRVGLDADSPGGDGGHVTGGKPDQRALPAVGAGPGHGGVRHQPGAELRGVRDDPPQRGRGRLSVPVAPVCGRGAGRARPATGRPSGPVLSFDRGPRRGLVCSDGAGMAGASCARARSWARPG